MPRKLITIFPLAKGSLTRMNPVQAEVVGKIKELNLAITEDKRYYDLNENLFIKKPLLQAMLYFQCDEKISRKDIDRLLEDLIFAGGNIIRSERGKTVCQVIEDHGEWAK